MPRPRFRAALAASLLPLLLVAGCSSNKSKSEQAGIKADSNRKPAPDFTLKDAEGKIVRLSDFRGKVVLLDFWATWCDPCAMEIPWFVEMQRKDKDRGFVVLGVSMDDEGWDAVKPFVKRLGVNYRVLLGNDEVSQLYGGVEALPTTFLIDRQGRIAAVHVGLADRRDFEDGVQQLLQDSAPVSADRTALPPVSAGSN